MSKISNISSYVLAGICLILLGMKFYYMKPGTYSRSELREFRKEYRDLFEYDLNTDSKEKWRTVLKNYYELTSVRKSILNKNLNSQEQEKLKTTIEYLEKIINKKHPLIPQSVKDDIVYFKNKHIYEYLYQLQSPVLNQ